MNRDSEYYLRSKVISHFGGSEDKAYNEETIIVEGNERESVKSLSGRLR